MPEEDEPRPPAHPRALDSPAQGYDADPWSATGALEPPRRSTLVHAVLGALPTLAAVGAVAGGALYATFWWGYVAFYERLGLAPGDVGLTQGDIVRTTGLALFLFAGYAVLAGAGWWLVLSALGFVIARLVKLGKRRWPALSHREPLGRRRQLADVAGRYGFRFTLTLLALVATSPFLIRRLANFVFQGNYRWYVVSATAALAAAVIYSGLLQRRPWMPSANAVAVWSGALGIVLLSTMLFLRERGADLATNISSGNPPYYSQFIFQIQREPVCIVIGGNRRPAVLLGETEGGVILFDRLSKVVVRPADRPELANRVPPDYRC